MSASDNSHDRVSSAISLLKSKKPLDAGEGLKRLVVLCSQGEDVTKSLPNVSKIMSKQNISAIRQRNYITSSIVPIDNGICTQLLTALEMDYNSTSPLIQSIAVRQAGDIVNHSTIGKCAPIILKAATHNDPFVRRTAALSILKVYVADPRFFDAYPFKESLNNLLNDSNMNVAANAAATLMEINMKRELALIEPSFALVTKLLKNIGDANEWSQINILNFANTYRPCSEDETGSIISFISGHLTNNNSGITYAAIRLLINKVNCLNDTFSLQNAIRVIIPQIASLANNPTEIQYMALKSISILLQRYPTLVSTDISQFFCRADDKSFIKLEKLSIIVSLTSASNVQRVMEELKKYTSSGDEAFARRTIQVIGQICLLFPTVADACVETLEGLLQSPRAFCVQETIVVSANILRQHRDKYAHIISRICQCIPTTFSDHAAKATLAWIIGEFCSKISNTAELIDAIFIENYLGEPQDVQLAILTAVVKFYLRNTEDPEAKGMLETIFSMSINDSDDPDLRDRAYLYLKLINDIGEDARSIVQSPPPPSEVLLRTQLNPDLVAALVPLIGTPAALYGKFPSEFVPPIEKDRCTPENPPPSLEIPSQPSKLPILAEASQETFNVRIAGKLEASGDGSSRVLTLRVTNNGDMGLQIARIAIRANALGLATPEDQLLRPIDAGGSQKYRLPLVLVQPPEDAEGAPELDLALVVDRPAPIFAQVPLQLTAVLLPESAGRMTKNAFLEVLHNVPNDMQMEVNVPGVRHNGDIKDFLHHENLFFMARQGESTFFTAAAITGDRVIVCVAARPDGASIVAKSMNQEVSRIVVQLVARALSQI